MGDIIQLLPDSVANQIAAGEVVQRPSSVVKELMENAIDAGACTVRVVLQHAGKSRVQVIDDGKGMSPKDARMAFERHATSKISTSLDLFHLRTMGFRGEALASIASVAEVEARTRRAGDELGTFLLLADSELKRQEHVSCDKGTSVTVKNLFYNVPARRKFLKSDATEARNVVTAFLRVALAWPGVAFTLENNGTVIYDLPASGRRQRLVDTFGRGLDGTLVPVSCETGIVSISGFACTPSRARKSPGEQYFFANDRFMKHGFFHKAVVEAYSRLIGAESIPSYFLYFTVDPSTIDVNIHPTKTEIKFQDEVAIFQILLASVREALGKFNITPAIDFDTEGQVEIPGERGEAGVPREPVVSYTPGYSPFHYRSSLSPGSSTFEGEAGVPARWEGLFEAVREERQVEQARIPGMLPGELSGGGITFLQLKRRYIVTSLHSGLVFIDQGRAHERVLFDHYRQSLEQRQARGQQSLFPEVVEFPAGDCLLVRELLPELVFLGFELTGEGERGFLLQATPPGLSYARGREALVALVEYYKGAGGAIRERARDNLALSLAKATAIPGNVLLDGEEMGRLFDALFACKSPNFTVDGRVIVHVLSNEEINRWF